MKRLFCIRVWLTLIIFLLPLTLIGDFIFKDGFESPKAPLNDTGVTWGGDYPSGNNESCTGAYIDQQDCSHGRDVTHNDDSDGFAGFSFTKLDANGNALPAEASAWVCVRDEVTGLTWEVKTDDGGLRDSYNTYSWYNPDPNTNGGQAGYPNGGSCTGSDCDTHSYVQAVNELPEPLCGYRDWRMPGREELRSIVIYDYRLYGIFKSILGLRLAFPWSGSPHLGRPGWIWIVDVLGRDGSFLSSWVTSVLLVRGGQPAVSAGTDQPGCRPDVPQTTPTADFTVHGDGTVTHHATGLMWKRCVEGSTEPNCSDNPQEMQWWYALVHARGNAQYGFAGYHDWRLPNIKELASIVELSCSNPAINLSVFPNVDAAGRLWSSTPLSYEDLYDQTWILSFFDNGNAKWFARSDWAYTRLVRGGQ